MLKEPSGVAATVEEIVRPAVENLGLRLWDVRYEKEGADWILRIFIDRDEPLDMNTCEAATRAIDPILDEADPITQSYLLEVGSPGLGRHLTRRSHYEAFVGRPVLAKLYGPDKMGRKEVRGVLAGLDGEDVLLATDYGEERIPVKDASVVKACDDEGLFA